MDAAGSERAALFGISEGGPMSLLFAATYPERTSALVLYGSYARRTWDADHPFGRPVEEMSRVIEAGPPISRWVAWRDAPPGHVGMARGQAK